MTETELSIVNMPSKIISGIATSTQNSKEMNPFTAKIGKQWDRFYSEQIALKVVKPVNPELIYGVYTQYQSDHNGEYTILSGIESETKQQTDPDLLSIELDAGRYLVFKAKGELPAAIIDTWGFIWDYFSKNKNVERKYTTDFELYATDEVAIYIGII
ncbi:MAG: hypothetical protein SCALA702_18940 [Melioribacteraceae bacterium]|nr:MAG: hypothetical protein SCALA702_18940 [Melioribacteraceae bacterium]